MKIVEAFEMHTHLGESKLGYRKQSGEVVVIKGKSKEDFRALLSAEIEKEMRNGH